MSVVTSTIQSLDGHVNEKRTAVMSVGQLETPPSEPLSATDLTKDVPFQRTLETPIEDLPVRLPTATIDDSIDHLAIAEAVVDRLNALEPSLLAVEAIWRDLFALTGTLRTFAGAENISHSWKDLADHHKPSNFELMPGTAKIVRLGPTHAWIAARFTFRTNGLPPSFCSGQVGIAPSGDDWKIWMITSILEELQGHPSPDFVTASGTIENQHTASKNVDYEAVVVGAGYAGLCLTGRLRAMGVHHLLIERNDSIGDNWLKRYDSARFHTSKYYSDMPLGPIFRDGYDYFPSAKDLARGYQEYATKHKLNVECSTSLQSATFDAKTSIWTLNLNTRGQARTLKTFNVVFAIGAGGSVPVWPKLENREKFNGTLLHSATYKNAHDWKGKRGVVIGSANTAHDVAEDMLDAGMSVTMVQRGRTMIIPVPTYRKWADTVYNPTVPIEEADRQVMAIPVAITRQVSLMGARALAAKEPERYDSLERRGFRCERNADLWKLLMERLGGHYMDVGASKKIVDGLIKVKGDAKLKGMTENGVVFDDGSQVEADVVVACTGFDLDVLGEVTKIVGPEIGKNLDHYWGIDSEGELRGAYKPLSYPGIFYTGGGVTFARFYSRFVALQIKASLSGTPLRLYTKKYSQ